jgi:hypothetical protein
VDGASCRGCRPATTAAKTATRQSHLSSRFPASTDSRVSAMTGRSPISAGEEQRGTLTALAGSCDRGEADRASAVLLTLAGWTSRRIAEAFAVREDTVRLWRSDFRRSPRATRPPLWHSNRASGQTGRARREQRPDPYQQDLAGGPRRQRALANCRVAAKVCA